MLLTNTSVSTEAQLKADIQQTDTSAPTNWETITVIAGFTLTTDLIDLDFGSVSTVTITDQGNTITDGAGTVVGPGSPLSLHSARTGRDPLPSATMPRISGRPGTRSTSRQRCVRPPGVGNDTKQRCEQSL
jgi:hypothetical protein